MDASTYGALPGPDKPSGGLLAAVKARWARARTFQETVKCVEAGRFGPASRPLPALPSPPSTIKFPSPSANPLHLSVHRGTYSTHVSVVNADAVDEALARATASARDAAGAAIQVVVSGGSAAGAGAGAGASSAGGGAGVGAGTGVAASGTSVDDASSYSRSVYGTGAPPRVETSVPALVVACDPATVGDGAHRGSMSEEAELHRCSNAYTQVSQAHAASVAAVNATKSWMPKPPTLYPVNEASALYIPQVTLFRHSGACGYAFVPEPRQVAVVLSHKMSGCETMVSLVDRGVTKLTSECRVRLMRTLHTHLKIAYSHGHTTAILGTFGCERDAKLPPRHLAEIYSEVIRDHFPGCFKELVFAIPLHVPAPVYDEFYGVMCGYSAPSGDVSLRLGLPSAGSLASIASSATAGERSGSGSSASSGGAPSVTGGSLGRSGSPGPSKFASSPSLITSIGGVQLSGSSPRHQATGSLN